MDRATLMELVRGRRSTRRFKAEPVNREMLEQIIEAASWAPSASNRQDWEFTVVLNDALKQAMGQATQEAWDTLLARPEAQSLAEEMSGHVQYFTWFARAPVVIAVSAREPDDYMAHLCGANAADVAGHRTSAAMATQNLLLAAHALGLGACCLTAPLAAREALKSLLGLGRRRQLVCLVALGWPAGDTPAVARKGVDQIMRVIE